LWANRRLRLNASATVLTRDAEAFRAKAPHLAEDRAVELVSGDVRTFEFPAGGFSQVIHAAADTSVGRHANQPLAVLDTLVEGTWRALDFAVHCGASQFLLLSSGAVYGRQTADLVDETCDAAPEPTSPRSVYGEGKRVAEQLCACYRRTYGTETKIARCFAFVGPYLPLDAHFAIGNFIADALEGGPLRVEGDGTAVRSYLYAADLTVWLWTILLRGEPGRAYNVGSENGLAIRDVAVAVAAQSTPRPAIRIEGRTQPGKAPERYVPSTARARSELGLTAGVALDEAIRRTRDWALRHEPAMAAQD
jgi:nucleoside-diphosphate-sugar epimerase